MGVRLVKKYVSTNGPYNYIGDEIIASFRVEVDLGEVYLIDRRIKEVSDACFERAEKALNLKPGERLEAFEDYEVCTGDEEDVLECRSLSRDEKKIVRSIFAECQKEIEKLREARKLAMKRLLEQIDKLIPDTIEVGK